MDKELLGDVFIIIITGMLIGACIVAALIIFRGMVQ